MLTTMRYIYKLRSILDYLIPLVTYHQFYDKNIQRENNTRSLVSIIPSTAEVENVNESIAHISNEYVLS